MNQDELEGKGKQVEGRMKEGAGDLVGSERLQEEGTADRAEGEVQERWGEGKRKAGEAISDAGDRLKE